jgi:hypothetical protein
VEYNKVHKQGRRITLHKTEISVLIGQEEIVDHVNTTWQNSGDNFREGAASMRFLIFADCCLHSQPQVIVHILHKNVKKDFKNIFSKPIYVVSVTVKWC